MLCHRLTGHDARERCAESSSRPEEKAGTGRRVSNVLLKNVIEASLLIHPAYSIADPVRTVRVGKVTTVKRCWMGCLFCTLADPVPNTPLPLTPPGLRLNILDTLTVDWHVDRIKIRGGLSSNDPPDYWIHWVKALRERTTAVLQGFSAVEVYQWHLTSQRPILELLRHLKWAGLDRLGPGGSEMLVDRWRYAWAPYRLPIETWAQIVQWAAEAGLETTGTLIVVADLPTEVIHRHWARLRDAGVHHIEIKAFHGESGLASWGRPHGWEIYEAATIARDYFPTETLAISGLPDHPDWRQIFTALQPVHWLTTAWEVTP